MQYSQEGFGHRRGNPFEQRVFVRDKARKNSPPRPGIGSMADPELRSLPDLTRWFKSAGSAENRHDFQAFLTRLIPALDRCRHWHADTCAVSFTATHLPYIDYVPYDRIAVAAVCNGKGAKSSDDWGWLAAQLMAGLRWDHPVDRERLRLPEFR